MGPLKKIAWNCRKATFLIEKKQIGSITLRERLELKIHLAGCSVCRIFQKQSILINQMVKQLFQSSGGEHVHLDENYKRELQSRIDEELNKE